MSIRLPALLIGPSIWLDGRGGDAASDIKLAKLRARGLQSMLPDLRPKKEI